VFASDDWGKGFVRGGGRGAGCGESQLASSASSLTIEEGASLVRFGVIGWQVLWGLTSTYVHSSMRIEGVPGRSQLIASLWGKIRLGDQRMDYEYYKSLNSMEAMKSLLCMNWPCWMVGTRFADAKDSGACERDNELSLL
jgi:hypothetical protein